MVLTEIATGIVGAPITELGSLDGTSCTNSCDLIGQLVS